MGLFSNNKKLCPVCGEPTPRFLPTKVEGTAICKQCNKKIYLPNGRLEQMTLDEFLQYMNFYEENGTLRDRFAATYEFCVDLCSTEIILDMSNGWFRLKNIPNALVFEASHMKNFRILEGENVLFESQGNALRCYKSNVPQHIRGLDSEIEQFRIERQRAEFMEESERRRKDDAERRGEEYQTRYIYKPHYDNHEPFDNFYVEIILEHPYWNEFHAQVHGPRFDRDYPSVDSFLCDYENKAEKLHELAMNLMQLISPGAREVRNADVETASATRHAPTMAAGNNAIEEIKQYKELLDAGIITAEEFAMKKRQLLGL